MNIEFLGPIKILLKKERVGLCEKQEYSYGW